MPEVMLRSSRGVIVFQEAGRVNGPVGVCMLGM